MPPSRDLEDRFFAISIDMLCFLDFNGYFKELNPAWERTLGFTIEELKSRPFIEFVHPDDRERTLNQNAAVRGGGQALGFENRYLCRDGSYRWFHWNAAPDRDAHVIYSVARDVTARKEAEAERERLVSELQSALAEVRELQAITPSARTAGTSVTMPTTGTASRNTSRTTRTPASATASAHRASSARCGRSTRSTRAR